MTDLLEHQWDLSQRFLLAEHGNSYFDSKSYLALAYLIACLFVALFEEIYSISCCQYCCVVASFIECLHKLQNENRGLEEKIRSLTQRRDHLVAVNSRLQLSTFMLNPSTASSFAVSPSHSTLTPSASSSSLVSHCDFFSMSQEACGNMLNLNFWYVTGPNVIL
jgi:hypothetical protein